MRTHYPAFILNYHRIINMLLACRKGRKNKFGKHSPSKIDSESIPLSLVEGPGSQKSQRYISNSDSMKTPILLQLQLLTLCVGGHLSCASAFAHSDTFSAGATSPWKFSLWKYLVWACRSLSPSLVNSSKLSRNLCN